MENLPLEQIAGWAAPNFCCCRLRQLSGASACKFCWGDGRAHTRCHPSGLEKFKRREQRAARRRTERARLWNLITNLACSAANCWLIPPVCLGLSKTASIGLNISQVSSMAENFCLHSAQGKLETEPSSIIKSLLLITISFFRVQLDSQKVLNEYSSCCI